MARRLRSAHARHRCALATVAALFTFGALMPVNSGDAQDNLATPLPGEFQSGSEILTAESSLTLTISTDHVDFGEVTAGNETTLADAVVISISEPLGSWQLTCFAEATPDHTTNAPVTSLSYAASGSSEWTTFQTDPVTCSTGAPEETMSAFDYRLAIPDDASAGSFDVIVTYEVSTIE